MRCCPDRFTPMKQRSFASLSLDAQKKQPRREVFLAEMDKVALWVALLALIAPDYPSREGRPGRPPALCCPAQGALFYVWTRRFLQAFSRDDRRPAHMLQG